MSSNPVDIIDLTEDDKVQSNDAMSTGSDVEEILPAPRVLRILPSIFRPNSLVRLTILGGPATKKRHMFTTKRARNGGPSSAGGKVAPMKPPVNYVRKLAGRVINPNSGKELAFSQEFVRQAGAAPLPIFAAHIPLAVYITFRFSRPNLHFDKNDRKNQLVKKYWYAPHARGDVDNYQKFVLDALNKKAYADDRYIVAVQAVKAWCENADDEESTTVVIVPVELMK